MNASAQPQHSTAARSLPAGRRRAVAVVMALAAVAGGRPAGAQEPVEAVWTERELMFSYESAVAVYDCRSLEGRVAHILRAVGARPDLAVRAIGCTLPIVPPNARVGDPGSVYATLPSSQRALDARNAARQFVHLRVELRMPIEVTPEVLEEIRRDKSRRELVSRVTGNPAAKFDDPIAFPAQRQAVTLSRETIGLEPEECELLEQIAASVFRQLDLRVIRQSFACDRNRVSRFPPEIVVEALVAASAESGRAPEIPETQEGAPDPATPGTESTEPAEPASQKNRP